MDPQVDMSFLHYSFLAMNDFDSTVLLYSFIMQNNIENHAFSEIDNVST